MDDIKKTFQKYDADGNGFITYSEAHQVACIQRHNAQIDIALSQIKNDRRACGSDTAEC